MNPEQSFDINLLTSDLRAESRSSLWRPKTIYLLLVGLVVISWIGVWYWYAQQERAQQVEIARLENRANQVVDQRAWSEAETLRKTVAVKEADIRKIEDGLVLWSEILTQIETAVPPGTRLTEISANGDQVICKGITADYQTLATFILSIGKRKNVTDVKCLLSETTDQGIGFEVLLVIAEKRSQV